MADTATRPESVFSGIRYAVLLPFELRQRRISVMAM
jgi:hypothetical protein